MITLPTTSPPDAPWRDPGRYWPEHSRLIEDVPAPAAVLDVDAMAHNAHDMLRRANGMPIRVASKSVRVNAVLDAVLALPGFAGVLAFTLPEALMLAKRHTDVVVAYPTTNRAAISALAAAPELASRITLMVDSPAHLDFIDAVVSPGRRPQIRVALELDASYLPPLLPRIGVWRSPVRSPDQAQRAARTIVGRPGFRLTGVMSYEAQIAGLANKPTGRRAYGAVVTALQRASWAELVGRRDAAIAAIEDVAPLEFVNAGGTGSLERTATDSSVTDVAAGSGLFGPHLFDNYRQFHPAPALAFALDVVRKPTPDMATLLGGGWIASGPPAKDRLPQIVWPAGLTMVGTEMAGEVQTPVTGGADLSVGDRVWLRHTKAGELCEHVNEILVVQSGELVDRVPTYRGEGYAFL